MINQLRQIYHYLEKNYYFILRQWFINLKRREKNIIILAAILIGGLLFYTIILLPPQIYYTQAVLEYNKLNSDYTWLLNNKNKVLKLRDLSGKKDSLFTNLESLEKIIRHQLNSPVISFAEIAIKKERTKQYIQIKWEKVDIKQAFIDLDRIYALGANIVELNFERNKNTNQASIDILLSL